MSLDLITMGRVGVDLYPEQIGVPLPDVAHVREVARRHARRTSPSPPPASGARSAVITKVGDDPFGTYVRQALEGFGVDDALREHRTRRCARRSSSARSSRPTTSRSFLPRARTRRTWSSTADDLDLDAIRAARIFWVDRHRPVGRAEPLGDAGRARGARQAPAITVLDLDYRPMFWASREEARAASREALPPRRRSRSATRTSARPRSASASRARRPTRCASAASSSRSSSRARRACWRSTATRPSRSRRCRSRSSTGSARATRSAARCATGCSPAGSSSARCASATRPGALVASRLACADAMPAEAEVDALLGEVPA